MKLEFKDTLKLDATDLYFTIPNIEADITVKESKVTWNLTLDYRTWGIDSYNYQLNKLQIFTNVDTYIEAEERTDETELIFEVTFNPKISKHECKIYEEIVQDGEWKEEVYVKIPVEFEVEEKPATDTDNRAQIYVKYITLDPNGDEKKLTLTM